MLLPLFSSSLPPTDLPPTLVVDGQVIASREGGRWRAAKEGKGVWTRRTGGAFREIGLGTLGRPRRVTGFEENVEAPSGVFVRPSGPFGKVFFGGGKAAGPRRVAVLNPKSAVYERIVRSFLARRGVRVAAARITRLLRTDLDGDGDEEILLAASSREGLARLSLQPTYRADDYSLLLLRTVRAGKVVEIPLDFGKKGGVLDDLSVRAIADLDGDGRMEIVTGWSAWESSGAILWGFRAGRATKLAENGSGV